MSYFYNKLGEHFLNKTYFYSLTLSKKDKLLFFQTRLLKLKQLFLISRSMSMYHQSLAKSTKNYWINVVEQCRKTIHGKWTLISMTPMTFNVMQLQKLSIKCTVQNHLDIDSYYATDILPIFTKDRSAMFVKYSLLKKIIYRFCV